MKKRLLYALLFAIPVLLMGTVVIGNAYWKNSIKNDSASVKQNLYSVILHFSDSSEQTYSGLEYDSAFELPPVNDANFTGWTYNGDSYQPGYYVYSSFASASTTSITFVANL